MGVIEAPRGTLIHHYRIDEDEQVVRANLIVSTTHNNEAMNEAVRQVALQYLDGSEVTEALLNHIEVAIRAYDPCLSCATHALGQMPLEVELVDASGRQVDILRRDSDGTVRRPAGLDGDAPSRNRLGQSGSRRRCARAGIPAWCRALLPPAGHDIEYVTDFQLQPEHATDLVGRDLALFVDASIRAAAPFVFSAVAPARDRTFTTTP